LKQFFLLSRLQSFSFNVFQKKKVSLLRLLTFSGS
jgi:hypothetical protein